MKAKKIEKVIYAYVCAWGLCLKVTRRLTRIISAIWNFRYYKKLTADSRFFKVASMAISLEQMDG